MVFDPSVFGQGFHRFVELEYQVFGVVLAPLLHIFTFVILLLVFWRGNKAKLLFTIYFATNWLFLFGYWGVFAILYWGKIGTVYLLSYIAAPILLALITITWIRELFQKRLTSILSILQKAGGVVCRYCYGGFGIPLISMGKDSCRVPVI